MAQVHDDVHVVLDEEQIDAAVIDLAQDIHKLAALTRVQARGGLVEQDELRRRHQRAAKLADLLAAIGQIVDGLVAQMIHADGVEHLARLLAQDAFLAVAAAQVDDEAEHVVGNILLAAHHHVLQHRHGGKQFDILERSADARLDGLKGRLAGQQRIAEPDLAGRRRNDRVDEVQRRGLAGAVRADEGVDFALLHVNGEVIDRNKALEALDEMLNS